MQHSARVRNAVVAAVTSAIAANSTSLRPPSLQLWTGSAPANCSLSATGTMLGSAPIVSPGYMGTPASGAAALVATISGTFTLPGTVGYYRIVAGDGLCDEQGTVSLIGGGGDLQLAGASLAVVAGQPFSVSARNLVGVNP
jgi:hypothetical protein